MAVECKLKRYDENTCRLVGEIMNVSADERVVGKHGKVDVSLLRPITFDPMNETYTVIGEIVGKAFSDGLAL